MANDNGSLSHTKWNCKYHIVFAPKYRRQIIYRQLRADIGKILRELCERKGVEIIEAEWSGTGFADNQEGWLSCYAANARSKSAGDR